MKFSGFQPNEENIEFPTRVFSELLADFSSLAELKVFLYVFWRLERQGGTLPFLYAGQINADQAFSASLAEQPEPAPVALQAALERLDARGLLLVAKLDDGELLILLNTPRGQAALQGLASGRWRPGQPLELPVEYERQRPNLYVLYEQNIGPLTPVIADTLREAEQTYPAHWIEEAIQTAVQYNKRNWRYIEAILRRWQEGDRNDRQDRTDSEADRQRYARWDSANRKPR